MCSIHNIKSITIKVNFKINLKNNGKSKLESVMSTINSNKLLYIKIIFC